MLNIALVILLIISILMVVSVFLHSFEIFPKNIMRKFCDLIDWHIPGNERGFDGCSNYSVCKYCKREIMQDGQGNWYTGGGKKK